MRRENFAALLQRDPPHLGERVLDPLRDTEGAHSSPSRPTARPMPFPGSAFSSLTRSGPTTGN